MIKAKSPAFLFYTGDFTTGTQFFSDEQVGKYIRLLLAQHQTGHLTEKQMMHICKSYDEDIFSKFSKDESGKFYNERLEVEIQKRENYVASRSSNKAGKTKEVKTISKSYDNHMTLHMENENENKKEIEIEKTFFDKTFFEFLKMRKSIKKPASEKAIDLIKIKLADLSPDESKQIEILNQSILNCWQDVFPLRQQTQTKASKENGIAAHSREEIIAKDGFGKLN